MADQSMREIERDIEHERAELRGTLDEIADRLTFEDMWNRAGSYLRSNGDFGEGLRPRRSGEAGGARPDRARDRAPAVRAVLQPRPGPQPPPGRTRAAHARPRLPRGSACLSRDGGLRRPERLRSQGRRRPERPLERPASPRGCGGDTRHRDGSRRSPAALDDRSRSVWPLQGRPDGTTRRRSREDGQGVARSVRSGSLRVGTDGHGVFRNVRGRSRRDRKDGHGIVGPVRCRSQGERSGTRPHHRRGGRLDRGDRRPQDLTSSRDPAGRPSRRPVDTSRAAP
jgi:hypothetical protein